MKLAIILSCLFVLFLGVESRSYPHHVTLKKDIFNVYWAYNATDQAFYFKVVAKTTGWVGFALTLEKGSANMANYDIALGGVKNNVTYLKDYWVNGKTKPTLDTKQDVIPLSASEADGTTTLEYSRKADTQDPNNQDIKIKRENDSVVYMAWARGDADANSDTDYSEHGDKAQGGRGHTAVGYNMFTGQKIEPSTQTTTTSTTMYLVPSLAFLVVVQLLKLMLI
ncbi:hypothetical protein QZH41_012127 [Actinostola sp. cb2023]|nr:hypothetical protein QZH41_012127 [Actinostola sp. cb2023]